ncbi:hypothetical protein P8452_73813 [Trifolium repens]|nr:hypothetical protein P8452_73813 [Trifolium repens]
MRRIVRTDIMEFSQKNDLRMCKRAGPSQSTPCFRVSHSLRKLFFLLQSIKVILNHIFSHDKVFEKVLNRRCHFLDKLHNIRRNF